MAVENRIPVRHEDVVLAVDAKGGMELAAGAAMFHRFAYSETDAAVLLDHAVSVMRERIDRLRGVTRLHVPTREEPLIVVLIDELAALTAYITDRDLKRRVVASLSLLLSQGRAVGVSVVAAVQDPRKEVLGFRDLFPVRIGMRLSDPDLVDLVLGDGARDRGAYCDLIPESQPGTGFVKQDGTGQPLRIRAAWVSDEDIRALAASHLPDSLADLTAELAGEQGGHAA